MVVNTGRKINYLSCNAKLTPRCHCIPCCNGFQNVSNIRQGSKIFIVYKPADRLFAPNFEVGDWAGSAHAKCVLIVTPKCSNKV